MIMNNSTGSLVREVYTGTLALSAAATQVAVKISVNNAPAGDDQAYLDNVKLRAYPVQIIPENGGVATFNVSLLDNPLMTAVVPIIVETEDAPDLSEITYTPSLTFNSGNYMTPQAVTITSIDDSIKDDDKSYWIKIVDPNDLTDPNIVPSMQLAKVTVIDNEFPRILLINADNLTVAEGGIGGHPESDMFTVKLNGTPTQNVTVTITDNGDPDQVTISPSILTFTTPGQEINVTITAIDGDGAENVVHNTILNFESLSDDANYTGLTQSANVAILESDCNAVGFTKDPIDVSGPAGDPDCKIDLFDFAELALKWFTCNFPNSGTACP